MPRIHVHTHTALQLHDFEAFHLFWADFSLFPCCCCHVLPLPSVPPPPTVSWTSIHVESVIRLSSNACRPSLIQLTLTHLVEVSAPGLTHPRPTSIAIVVSSCSSEGETMHPLLHMLALRWIYPPATCSIHSARQKKHVGTHKSNLSRLAAAAAACLHKLRDKLPPRD